jgi:hypothetical protein
MHCICASVVVAAHMLQPMPSTGGQINAICQWTNQCHLPVDKDESTAKSIFYFILLVIEFWRDRTTFVMHGWLQSCLTRN